MRDGGKGKAVAEHFAAADARPDFICIGAQKAGTSWLYHQLTLHPDFWMPPIKELHYFDMLGKGNWGNSPRRADERDQLFLDKINEIGGAGYLDLESYSALFAPKATLLSGDITPSYSILNEEIIEQVVSNFKNLKVIFLARDPVERAWSQLSMQVRLRNLQLADPTDPDEVIRCLLEPRFLLRSYPSKIVARWKRHVPSDLFRVYFFDDLQRDPAGLRHSILEFLGADPEKRSGELPVDYNGQGAFEKLTLTDRVRSHLAKFFQRELEACAAELNGPAKSWPARYGFSLLWVLFDLIDDFDLLAWCAWIG